MAKLEAGKACQAAATKDGNLIARLDDLKSMKKAKAPVVNNDSQNLAQEKETHDAGILKPRRRTP